MRLRKVKIVRCVQQAIIGSTICLGGGMRGSGVAEGRRC